MNQTFLTPRQFALEIEEGISLPVGEIYCDSDEELIIWWDASTAAPVDIGFEYGEGVEFRDVTEGNL